MFDLDLSWIKARELRRKEGLLRKRERLLSAQIEKLGEDFIKTLRTREKISEQADELEKSLIKPKVCRPYVPSQRKPAEKKSEDVWARALKLAAEGKISEAKELVAGR